MTAKRRRSCKRCKGKGKLKFMHSNNRTVEGPMGPVTMPDYVPCPDCCLHNGPVKLAPHPPQPNQAERKPTHLRARCARCDKHLEDRPIVQGGKASQPPAKPRKGRKATLPHASKQTASTAPHKRRKRRRKLARKARTPSKPGLPSDADHIVLHYAHIWEDTVKARITWKVPSQTERGTMNMGVEFERPLRLKDGRSCKLGRHGIIHVRADGSMHPPWVSIAEGP